jgi:hypothetical protein
MYNISIYFYNIDIKHLQYTYETFEMLETNACNKRFQRNMSLLLGRMEAHRCVNFTGVELAGGAEITALMEKATIDLVEKAAVGLHTVLVVSSVASCAQGMGEYHPGRRERARARSTRPRRIGQAERKMCVSGLRSSNRELHVGELHPASGKLGRWSTSGWPPPRPAPASCAGGALRGWSAASWCL